MLRIWGRVNSINVQKVMWAVCELKIPHERIDAGMAFAKPHELASHDRRFGAERAARKGHASDAAPFSTSGQAGSREHAIQS